ncbi:unnamed protein product, partial [marine sediment metagenome]
KEFENGWICDECQPKRIEKLKNKLLSVGFEGEVKKVEESDK